MVMSPHMSASAADLAVIQVTATGVVVAVRLVVTAAALAVVTRLATAKFSLVVTAAALAVVTRLAKFSLTRSVRALSGSQLRNAREPRRHSR
jgi:hypothetical protein